MPARALAFSPLSSLAFGLAFGGLGLVLQRHEAGVTQVLGGVTIVLVSHALGSIEDLCDKAIWIHQGTLQMAGEPEEIIHAYTTFLDVGETAITMEEL